MSADFYCYPGTNVLRNKFNIHNKKQIDDIEQSISFLRLARLDDNCDIFANGFSFQSLKSLHKYIMDTRKIWNTVIEDIPVLYDFCSSQIESCYSFEADDEDEEEFEP